MVSKKQCAIGHLRRTTEGILKANWLFRGSNIRTTNLTLSAGCYNVVSYSVDATFTKLLGHLVSDARLKNKTNKSKRIDKILGKRQLSAL